MFTHWKPKLATVGGFLLGLINYLAFFGVDARTLREQMTAHYLFLILALICTGICVAGIYFWRQSTRTTKNNVQSKVRRWLDDFSLPHSIVTWHLWIFGFDYRPPTGAFVYIAQLKNRPDSLMLSGRIRGIFDNLVPNYDSLTPEQRIELNCRLYLEMGRAKMSFYNQSGDLKGRPVEIIKWIPITPKLTQAAFMDALAEINYASDIIWNTINLFLGASPIQPTLPSSSTPDTEASPSQSA